MERPSLDNEVEECLENVDLPAAQAQLSRIQHGNEACRGRSAAS